LRDKVGRDTVDAAMNDLAPDVRGAIEQGPMPGWVPVEAIAGLFDAVARRTNQDPGALHAEVVAVATEQMIQSVWRVLVRLTTDSQLVSQTPVYYRKAWNRGTLSAEIPSKNNATLTLASWPAVPDFTIRGLQVALERTLTLAGRKDVVLTPTRTSDGVHYAAKWR
jgi:hypothetical protein